MYKNMQQKHAFYNIFYLYTVFTNLCFFRTAQIFFIIKSSYAIKYACLYEGLKN